jgi:hypothetical protein
MEKGNRKSFARNAYDRKAYSASSHDQDGKLIGVTLHFSQPFLFKGDLQKANVRSSSVNAWIREAL